MLEGKAGVVAEVGKRARGEAMLNAWARVVLVIVGGKVGPAGGAGADAGAGASAGADAGAGASAGASTGADVSAGVSAYCVNVR